MLWGLSIILGAVTEHVYCFNFPGERHTQSPFTLDRTPTKEMIPLKSSWVNQCVYWDCLQELE